MKRLLTIGLVAALLSCGGEDNSPTGPTPGDLVVRLSGPPGAGAALVTLLGGPIDTASSDAYFTAFGPLTVTAKRVLVAGENLDGVLFSFHVPDRRTTYTALVTQIADGATYALRDPTEYQAVVERP